MVKALIASAFLSGFQDTYVAHFLFLELANKSTSIVPNLSVIILKALSFKVNSVLESNLLKKLAFTFCMPEIKATSKPIFCLKQKSQISLAITSHV